MGTLKDKLNYLKDSLSVLTPSFDRDWVKEMSANPITNLRERINFVYACVRCFSHFEGDPWNYNKETFDYVCPDGTVYKMGVSKNVCCIFPPVNLKYDTTVLPPLVMRKNLTSNSDKFLDFSAVKTSPDHVFSFRIINYSFSSIVFAEHQKLEKGTLEGHCRGSFSYGMKFGKAVYECNSNWMNGIDTAKKQNIFVSVEEGFEGTLYLSKFDIKAECLVSIINNLADMSATDTVYELNIGPDNLAKLTDEQLAVGYAKGWNIT